MIIDFIETNINSILVFLIAFTLSVLALSYFGNQIKINYTAPLSAVEYFFQNINNNLKYKIQVSILSSILAIELFANRTPSVN